MTRVITTSILTLLLFTHFAIGADKGAKGKTSPPAAVADTPQNDPLATSAEEQKPGEPPPQKRPTAMESTLILKVKNPSEARKTLQAEAEKRGGYLSFVDGQRMVVKLPPSKLLEMVKHTETLGLVLEKRFSREDLTMEMAELNGQLKSKEEILEKTRGFFDDSDVAATLAIEQTMTGLVEEMEAIKGRLRVLQDRSDWAVLEIPFRFRERDRVMYVQSDFDWLNTVDLDRFVEEFTHDE